MSNLKQQILNVKGRSTATVDLTETWNFKVLIRAWTPHELTDFLARLDQYKAAGQTAGDVYAYSAYKSLCDERGELLFDDETSLEVLKEKDLPSLAKIHEAILTLNGMRSADQDNFRKPDSA